MKFVGSEGWVETGDAGGIDLSDEALRAELPRHVPPQEKAARGTDAALHARNFFDSVKSRKPAVCNADVMRKSHVACHAAFIAWMLGRRLTLDPARGVFRTPPERDCWT